MIDLMVRGALALIGLATVITVVWSLRASSPAPTVAQLSQAKPNLRPSTALGMQSCAASGCHGNPNAESLTNADAKDVWKSSFTHWTAVDPHQKAYKALLSPLAIQMAKILKAGPSGTVLPAHEDVRCLACHTNPTLAVNDPKGLRSEGVSCEACHGNAENWRKEHTAWTTPNAREVGVTISHFIDLKTDAARSAICAGCHVGSPAYGDHPVRDMNHDMIAAGHPELKHNAKVYHADYLNLMSRLSPHWAVRPQKPLDRPGAFYLFARALADDRQKRSKTDPRTPWPEFSDTAAHLDSKGVMKVQKCVDCHQGLKFPSTP